MGIPQSFFSVRLGDSTRKKNGEPESTTFQVTTAPLASDGSNYAAQLTLMANFLSDVLSICIGSDLGEQYIGRRVENAPVLASSTLAQRENKWLCRYHDNTTNKKFSVSIGTADLTLLTPGEEFLDLTTTPGSTFKTDFEALVKSPDDDSHAVTLDSVQFVGRNT